MLDVAQFRMLVVRPTLKKLGMWSQAAENLVVGTAVQESRLEYLHQLGGGPALSLFQVEPLTLNDILDRWLPAHPMVYAGFVDATGIDPRKLDGNGRRHQMICNLAFGVAVCRLRYRMDKAPFPEADDIGALAHYWKRVYNTYMGKGEPEQFVQNYRRYVEYKQ